MRTCACNRYANLLGVCPHGHEQVGAVQDDGYTAFSKPECCPICPVGVAETVKLLPAEQQAKDKTLSHAPYPIRGDTFIPPKCPIKDCPNSIAYWIPRGDERPMVSDRCHVHERMRGGR